MDRMRVLAWCSVASVVLLSIAASVGLNPHLIWLIKRLPGQDITGHFLVMAGLCVAVLIGFDGARMGGRKLGSFALTLLVACAAMLDEWLQGFIPGRFFSMIDLAAGLLGTASAAMVVAVWRGADAPATGDTQVASDS
jgi:hypothetical protein